MATVNSNELRKGILFTHEGVNYAVIDYEHIKKGRGLAVIRVKVKNIANGSIIEKTFNNSEKLELLDSERRSAQFLYSDEKESYFMDNEDYSQFSFPVGELDWEKNFLKQGTKVVILYISGKPVTLEIPKAVDLEIIETSDAVRGNTSSNAYKEATVETGYKVMVPLFSKTGDSIRINTETGDYTGKSEKQ
jgi:elongation factor P